MQLYAEGLIFCNYGINTQLTARPSISPGRRRIQSKSGIVVIRHRAGWVGAVAVFICDEIARNNFLFLRFTGFLVTTSPSHSHSLSMPLDHSCPSATLSQNKQTKTNGSFLVSLLRSKGGERRAHVSKQVTRNKPNQDTTGRVS